MIPRTCPTSRRRSWRAATSTRTGRSPRRSWPWSCSLSPRKAQKIKPPPGFEPATVAKRSSTLFNFFFLLVQLLKKRFLAGKNLVGHLNAFTSLDSFLKHLQLSLSSTFSSFLVEICSLSHLIKLVIVDYSDTKDCYELLEIRVV